MDRRGGPGGPYGLAEDEDDLVLEPRQVARRARFDALAAHPLVAEAAVVAHTFGLDPVDVLNETDELRQDIRVAAHNTVIKLLNKK